MMNNSFLSVDGLAQSLNVPKSWVYSRTRQTGPESMPRLKIGKYLRFRLEDVIEWIEYQNKKTGAI
jgi:predicted DNA-binding transcriptional regulator AlpA